MYSCNSSGRADREFFFKKKGGGGGRGDISGVEKSVGTIFYYLYSHFSCV